MMPTRTFYVYVLYRPWDMTPCYVGKGQGDRVHYHAKLGGRHYNSHLAAIFKKAGGALPFDIVLETADEAEALAHEVELVAVYGRKVDGSGVLANRTLGGEGTTGLRWTMNADDVAKRRIQIADMWRNPEYRAQATERMLGNRYFENAVFSDDMRIAARERMLGRQHALGYRWTAAQCAVQRARMAETAPLISKSVKDWWANDDNRSALLARRATSSAYQNRNKRVQSPAEKAKRVASRLRTLAAKAAAKVATQ